MQLEATMKQRFSWTALLLITACLVRSSHGGMDGDKCTSNGIIGTFNQSGTLDSLTITPIEFKNTLEVTIEKEDDADPSIQIYMTLEEDSGCTITDAKFDIVSPDGKETCSFIYTVDVKKLKVKGSAKELEFEYSDPFQASFELQVKSDGNVENVMVQTSSGDDDTLADAKKKCVAVAGKITTFTLKFYPIDKEKECGVQFEMKGKYKAPTMKMDDKGCTVEAAGSSNDDNTDPDSTTTASGLQTTTESGLPTWAWYVIGGCGALVLIILIVVIVLIVYFCCLKKKKDSADEEDVEAAPEEPDVQPADASTVTGPGGAEPSGVEPTQQNPEDKSEDKSEAKPKDKSEDKPEDKSDDDDE